MEERLELVEGRGGLVVMEGFARVLSVRARGRGEGDGSRREEVEAVAREDEGPGEGSGGKETHSAIWRRAVSMSTARRVGARSPLDPTTCMIRSGDMLRRSSAK